MKFNIRKSIFAVSAAALTMGGLVTVSCTGDLDVDPINPQVSQTFDKDALFNKIYDVIM